MPVSFGEQPVMRIRQTSSVTRLTTAEMATPATLFTSAPAVITRWARSADSKRRKKLSGRLKSRA